MTLDKITATLVNTAVEIYLQLAYGDAVSRNKHVVRFSDDMPVAQVLAAFVSEDTSLKAWSLRLGSQDYPHMKLMLREAYIPGEFAFCVDRHDCFSFNREEAGCQKWIDLQARNYRLKKSIEDAWYETGVPTLRLLRERLLSAAETRRIRSGAKVLLVDNDCDAVAIMEMILARGGYECCRAGSVAEARELTEREGETFLAALVDLLLPDGMGSDIVAFLRAETRTQNIPVIIMSGMPESEADCRAADAYLRKPFSAQEVLDALTGVIERYFEADGQFLSE